MRRKGCGESPFRHDPGGGAPRPCCGSLSCARESSHFARKAFRNRALYIFTAPFYLRAMGCGRATVIANKRRPIGAADRPSFRFFQSKRLSQYGEKDATLCLRTSLYLYRAGLLPHMFGKSSRTALNMEMFMITQMPRRGMAAKTTSAWMISSPPTSRTPKTSMEREMHQMYFEVTLGS